MAKKKTSRTVAETAAAGTRAAKGRQGATNRPQKKAAPKTPAGTGRAEVDQPDGPLLPPAGGIAVRCYRHGLGDCLLLAFSRGAQANPSYLLIDCGVHMRQDSGPQRLAQVMDNVRQATGGSLDVVVATHEHADHLSGFVQKDSAFLGNDAIKVKQFWVAWTEKRGDKQADQLRKKRGAARAALEKAIQRLEGLQLAGLGPDPARLDAAVARIRQLMDFETMPGESGQRMPTAAATTADKRPSSNEAALEWLKQEADRVRYCEPGEVLSLDRVPDVRAYVLGPPRDEDFLKRDLPSGGPRTHGDNEVYLAGSAALAGFCLALEPAAIGDDGLVLTGDDERVIPRHMRFPFDRRIRREFKAGDTPQDAASADPWQEAETVPVEIRNFFAANYFSPEQSWRGIDGDWLAVADELALNLDSDTNNTSLVLAFEYGPPGQGKVLLFAADAQVGNWLSWRSQPYGTGKHKVTADELLQRTIFYKVGHHGSHNATLQRDTDDKSPEHPLGAPYGLELMPSHLLAFIPVDRDAVEKNMPTPWAMPYPPMYETLLRKTNGRVLRADGLNADKELPKGSVVPQRQAPTGPDLQEVQGFTEAKWREAAVTFKEGRTCPLYYDVLFDSP